MMKAMEREPLYCDCHGPSAGVVMGYLVDSHIAWFRDDHGKRHFKAVVVPCGVDKNTETVLQRE